MGKKIISVWHPILKKNIQVNEDDIIKAMSNEERAARAANVRWGNEQANSGSEQSKPGRSAGSVVGSALKETGRLSMKAVTSLAGLIIGASLGGSAGAGTGMVAGGAAGLALTGKLSSALAASLLALPAGALVGTGIGALTGAIAGGRLFSKPKNRDEKKFVKFNKEISEDELKERTKYVEDVVSRISELSPEEQEAFLNTASEEELTELKAIEQVMRSASGKGSVEDQNAPEGSVKDGAPVEQQVPGQTPEPKVGIQRKPGQPIEQVGKAATKKDSIDNLLENPFNRELDRKKIDSIKDEIKRTEEIYPIVYAEIDHDGNTAKLITDGHHRYQALKELGYKEIPVVMQDHRGTKTKAPKSDVTKSEE